MDASLSTHLTQRLHICLGTSECHTWRSRDLSPAPMSLLPLLGHLGSLSQALWLGEEGSES